MYIFSIPTTIQQEYPQISQFVQQIPLFDSICTDITRSSLLDRNDNLKNVTHIVHLFKTRDQLATLINNIDSTRSKVPQNLLKSIQYVIISVQMIVDHINSINSINYPNNSNPYNLSFINKLLTTLKGYQMCPSGIGMEQKCQLEYLITKMGGKYSGTFSSSNTTHLIESKFDAQSISAKHRAVVTLNKQHEEANIGKGSNNNNNNNGNNTSGTKVHIVDPNYIFDCYIHGKKLNESDYPLKIFNGKYLSVTGIKAKLRSKIRKIVIKLGGKV